MCVRGVGSVWRATLCVSLAVADATPAAGQVPALAQDAGALSSSVDSLFLREIRPDAPGCAVGAYRNGTIVLARGYGTLSVEDGRPITRQSAFNLGSASKPYTALATLLLERHGHLSLDDDVRRWVPELPDYGRPIRVRDLLQHTSGLRDFETLQRLSGRPVATQREFLDLVTAQRALNFAPGTRHEYSHTDFGVLGTIVERSAGVPFGEYLHDTVFLPMGMNNSFVDDVRHSARRERAIGHRVSPRGSSPQFPGVRTFGGDNVYASVEDLAAWDRALASPDGAWSGVVRRMLSRPTLPGGDTIPYAYGLRIGEYRGLRTVSRRGHPPGTRAEFLRFPEQAFAVATLCNSDGLDASRLARSVAEIYLGSVMAAAGSRPPPPTAVALPALELARYAGVYRSTDDPWTVWLIELRADTLGEVVFDDSRDEVFYPMTPAGQGRFVEIGSTGNVGIFSFRQSSPEAPMRLEMSWNDGPAERLERVADSSVWRPSAADIAEYVGRWFSSDIDAAWQFVSRGASLLLARRGQPEMTLRPIARDQFLRTLGPEGEISVRLQFLRNSAGRLTGLVVSTAPGEDAVGDLLFHRLAPD